MSAPIGRVGDLEINQDLTVQRRMWVIQRIGWAAMALIVLLGAAGLFGQGPISQATVGNVAGPLYLEYERFGRYQSSSTLRFRIRAPEKPGPIQLWIASGYLAGIEIQQLTPSPDKVTIGNDGVFFHINTAGSGEPDEIILYFQYQSMGKLSGAVGIAGEPSIAFTQFVYP